MNEPSVVDHAKLFARIASELPAKLLDHLFVVGSLAAACHFIDDLQGRGVKTKDADLVVHPAGDVLSAKEIAELLLERGWRRKDNCYSMPSAEPADKLRALRLYPPDHEQYFVELLNVPAPGQETRQEWIAVQLADGWYGLPSFEFLALTAVDRKRSSSGLEYASPCMMALANLLSHRGVGTARMSAPIAGRKILRAAKDLGRTLALSWLAGTDEVDGWCQRWRAR